MRLEVKMFSIQGKNASCGHFPRYTRTADTTLKRSARLLSIIDVADDWWLPKALAWIVNTFFFFSFLAFQTASTSPIFLYSFLVTKPFCSSRDMCLHDKAISAHNRSAEKKKKKKEKEKELGQGTMNAKADLFWQPEARHYYTQASWPCTVRHEGLYYEAWGMERTRTWWNRQWHRVNLGTGARCLSFRGILPVVLP